MVNRSNRRHTPAKYPRSARVNELLREVIADALEREVDDDPRLQLVTITGVETEEDLRRAVVYFSALAADASPDEVIVALDSKRVAMQKAIASGSTFKRTPQLRFVPDMGIIEGQRIESLLKDLPPISEQPDLDDDESPYGSAADDVK